jgi:hypothetical protein
LAIDCDPRPIAPRASSPAGGGSAPSRKELLSQQHDQRTFGLVLQTGDEVMETLQAFARAQRLRGSQLTAIGALRNAVLAFFDLQARAYLRLPVDEQAEVLALLGDVASESSGPSVHAHVVLGLRDGSTRGGHLLEAHVRPTLEVVITEMPTHLQRVHDPETGLTLIRFE